jgi:hypothetical protein
LSQYSVIGTPADQFHDEVGPASPWRAGVEHLGDVRMIHHRQRLALGLEAGDDLLGVHAQLDDLERDAADDGFGLLGHVDHAHAAFAQQMALSSLHGVAVVKTGSNLFEKLSRRALELLEQPQPGVVPLALGGRFGDAQRLGRVRNAQADVVTKLYQFGAFRRFGGQFLQGFINREQLVVGGRLGDLDLLEVDPLQPVTVPGAIPFAGAIDQDATHGLGRGGEEVAAVLPPLFRRSGELYPSLMDQSRCLESLTGPFIGHLLRRQTAEFLVDDGEKFARGFWVTVFDSPEDLRELAHVSRRLEPCSESWLWRAAWMTAPTAINSNLTRKTVQNANARGQRHPGPSGSFAPFW